MFPNDLGTFMHGSIFQKVTSLFEDLGANLCANQLKALTSLPSLSNPWAFDCCLCTGGGKFEPCLETVELKCFISHMEELKGIHKESTFIRKFFTMKNDTYMQ